MHAVGVMVMLGTHRTAYLYSSWKHSSYHLLTVIFACCFCFVSSGLFPLKVCTEKGGKILAPKELKKETGTTELFLYL